MANKHVKKCSTSLASRNIYIKSTVRYHYKPIKTAKIKNNDNTNANEDTEKLDHTLLTSM